MMEDGWAEDGKVESCRRMKMSKYGLVKRGKARLGQVKSIISL